MRRQDATAWMLAEAVEQLRSVERLQRQFFRMVPSRPLPCWEPPLDMVVDRNGLCLVLALPGVASDHLEVTLEEGAVVVRGERSFGAGLPVGEIIRLEIPYGRFERRVTLPYGNYRLAEVQLENGCLRLNIEQLL